MNRGPTSSQQVEQLNSASVRRSQKPYSASCDEADPRERGGDKAGEDDADADEDLHLADHLHLCAGGVLEHHLAGEPSQAEPPCLSLADQVARVSGIWAAGGHPCIPEVNFISKFDLNCRGGANSFGYATNMLL